MDRLHGDPHLYELFQYHHYDDPHDAEEYDIVECRVCDRVRVHMCLRSRSLDCNGS